MSAALRRSRILVADDQPDVARTLCTPLRHAGAILTFVSNGEEVSAKLEEGPFDLLVVDMKMLPGEWGGLWLLRELREGGWQVPALVLSGEGTKRQTVEALRLGAVDWIDKSEAASELEGHCEAILQHAMSDALDHAAARLPTPVAHRLAAYSRAMGTEKQAFEGLWALEVILRVTSIIGMCSTQPHPLPVTAKQIARPSMGTWLTLCTALADLPYTGKTFRSLVSSLMPDSAIRTDMQEQVQVRNAMVHRGYAPDDTELERLNAVLARFAHRAFASWQSRIVVPTSMTHDGTAFAISLLSLVGAGLPRHEKMKSQNYLLTGQLTLIEPNSDAFYMTPWAVADRMDSPRHMRCLLFDGVKMHRPENCPPDSLLMYADLDTGGHNIHPKAPAGLVWSAVSPWFPSE